MGHFQCFEDCWPPLSPTPLVLPKKKGRGWLVSKSCYIMYACIIIVFCESTLHLVHASNCMKKIISLSLINQFIIKRPPQYYKDA